MFLGLFKKDLWNKIFMNFGQKSLFNQNWFSTEPLEKISNFENSYDKSPPKNEEFNNFSDKLHSLF